MNTDEEQTNTPSNEDTDPLSENYLFKDETIFESEVSEDLVIRLVCSDPAGGQMLKRLERRVTGSNTWEMIEDLTMVISNYPQGMVFVTDQNGFIITDYHRERAFLYRTEDGGHSWTGIYLGEENDIYSNGTSIEYDSESCVLSVKSSAKISEDDIYENRTYISEDFGATWELVNIPLPKK
ncbi:MAG: hypothetical protein K6G30_02450 [Acetatifactor sp.]|nr:hypothetical protein [Acetatifactor sp.]